MAKPPLGPDGQPIGSYDPNRVTAVDENQAQTPDKFLGLANADPSWAIYQQQAAASDQVARAEAMRQASLAQAGMAQLPGQYSDMLAQSLKQISDKFENQGMYSSSTRLGAQNNAQGQIEGDMLAKRNAYADQIGQSNVNLQQQLAQSRVGKLGQQLTSANKVAGEAGGQGVNLVDYGPNGSNFYGK